ncbi:MAG: hypothetical protein AB7E47_07220 [Desulfovibrionaceae bacterium]
MNDQNPCPQCGCEMRMVSDIEKDVVIVVFYCSSCGYATQEESPEKPEEPGAGPAT